MLIVFQKPGSAAFSFENFQELLNKAILVTPLPMYDFKMGPLIEELYKAPQWFNVVRKLVSGQLMIPPPTNLPIQCRIFNDINNVGHQYLVVLPNPSIYDDINAFIMIDNGVNSEESTDNVENTTPVSLMNIVHRRTSSHSKEIDMLVETIGKALSYYVWRMATTSVALDFQSPQEQPQE